MAYTMAYTEMSRRGYRTGSLFQRCESRFGCPALVGGERPEHKCQGRWFGVIEFGVTADGERKRRTVSGKTKGVVQRRLRDLALEKDKSGTANAKRTVTVAKWAETWREAIATEIRPTSLTTDKAALKWIVGTIGSTKLADLSPADVRAVAAAIRREGGSSSTALRYHGSMIRMLKAATQEGYAVPGNVLLAKAPKAAVNDRDALSTDQCLAVVEFLTRRNDKGDLLTPRASRWVLALLQGLRQSEALGLTWQYGVDLAVPALAVAWQVKSLPYQTKGDTTSGFMLPDGFEAKHLVGSTHLVRPKSDAGKRVMPLVPWAASALAEWQQASEPNQHGLVWAGRSDKSGTWPRNPASDRVEWEEIQKAAKVAHPTGRPFHVHEIRHSTATLLLALGVSEAVRTAIMGHSTIASTRGYEHVDMAPMLAALEQMSTALGLTAGD